MKCLKLRRVYSDEILRRMTLWTGESESGQLSATGRLTRKGEGGESGKPGGC